MKQETTIHNSWGNLILTKNEINVLKYLNTIKSSDDASVFKNCKLKNQKEASRILDLLKKNSCIEGVKPDVTGWIFIKITAKGEQFLRDYFRPWYKKVNWSNPWIVTVGGGLIVGIFLLLIAA